MKLFITIAALALLANVEAANPSRKPKPAKPDVSKLPARGTFDGNTPGFDYVKPIWEKLMTEKRKSQKALFIVEVEAAGCRFERKDKDGEILFVLDAHYGSSKCSVFEILSADHEKLEQCQKDIQADQQCLTDFYYNIEKKTWRVPTAVCFPKGSL